MKALGEKLGDDSSDSSDSSSDSSDSESEQDEATVTEGEKDEESKIYIAIVDENDNELSRSPITFS